tara:strand:+ start:558 stop:815 length:258 start_codon:yes stop_codon:yes gene_type:complete
MSFFDSFHKSNLTYDTNSVIIEENIDEINEGFTKNENFLFYRDNELIKIYDRFFNHNLGRLFLKGNNAICPLHEWELDLKNEQYI